MKITILTACRNAVTTIGDAIASVRRQILPPGVSVEHLIIDGGSTDGTARFATLSEPDRGMYDALNKGLRLATGDVIGILNADDVLDGEDVLARIAQAFEAEGDAAPLQCVYGNIRFVHNLGGPTVRVCFARFWRPWMFQWGYMPPHPGVFIRRDCFERWGGYVGDRDAFRISADDELLIRFFRVHKMRARYLPLCTTVMRTGGASTKDARAVVALNREVIKANRLNGYFCCWPMLLPKYLVKVWEVLLPRLGLYRKPPF